MAITAGVPGWFKALAALALVRNAFALAAWGVGAGAPGAIPTATFAIHIAVYSTAGVSLIVLGARDRRAIVLGVLFLLLGTSFADRFYLGLTATNGGLISTFATALLALRLEVFQPYCVWRFVSDFPRVEHRRGRVAARKITSLSGVVGLTMAALSLLAVATPAVLPIGMLELVDRGTAYWSILFGLMAAALIFSAVRLRWAGLDEARRVRIAIAGLIAGFFPLFALVFLLTAVPALYRWAEQPHVARALGYTLVYPGTLSIPFTVGYAVLARRALELKLIVRQAMQYAFARYSIASFTALPITAFVVLLYLRRHQAVVDVVSGPEGLLLGGSALVGLVAMRARGRLLDHVDRRFFRAQYDAREILGGLVDRLRGLSEAHDVANTIEGDVDRALHVRHVHMLLLDRASGRLVPRPGGPAPLDLASGIARAAAIHREPIDFDPTPSFRTSSHSQFGPADEAWLISADAWLLVPLTSADATLVGLLILGEKKSELPYTREDRLLLRNMADTAALVLERSTPTHELAVERPTPMECVVCGAINDAQRTTCIECESVVRPSHVPQLLAGKFRPLRRIGNGGMGVVYLAVDLSLNREVALKTLPAMAPREALRLRKEARAMAAVSHPNLALIHGAETWNHAPVLVLEYLRKGTLADRLAHGPLPLIEAVELAETLASALDRLHNEGLLHRDIKPSNVGFSAEGTPKLLDFGLARVLEVARTAPPGAQWDTPSVPTESTQLTEATGLGGTLAYLPPEAFDGTAPSPRHDLWALTMVCYECIAGRHPFAGETAHWMIVRIKRGEVPDIRTFAPDTPASAAEFLSRALGRSQAKRPATARELAAYLRDVRLQL
jgi:hypothetical protein